MSRSRSSSPFDVSVLLGNHERESAAIRERFEATGNGRAAAAERAAWIDAILLGLFHSHVPEDSRNAPGFALAALGGYGRSLLFPHSDIDVLFLCGNPKSEERCRTAIATISRAFWDLRLRISPATRTLAECGQFQASNVEFPIAMLDCRFLAGDADLFSQLHDVTIPHLVARERRELVRALRNLTLGRHAAQGNTIFHLEPNLKDSPGGLRDYGVARWLARIVALDGRSWAAPESLWPAEMSAECGLAFDFLAATRCFIHYQRNRDGNLLTYELQDYAAESGIGIEGKRSVSAADWMRRYFRNARAIRRLTAHMLEEIPPARSSLYEMFEGRRSRLSNEDFSVSRGKVFLRRPALLKEPESLLRLFEFLARHGLPLSGEARRQVERRVSHAGQSAVPSGDVWPHFRELLRLPRAAAALREMHRAGLLVLLFPEFRAIDALVIRDFYHRYTVDEHSFLTIENLQRLLRSEGEWERRYGEILGELEQPELLYLSLLLHDVGKGMDVDSHIEGSLRAAEAALGRLSLTSEERDTVRFLIARHLEMSATMQRRDIFDPAAVRDLARVVGTPERLKLLCLFTYADIRSVNPEALTPWKAEMLWQLYVATMNHLDRGVDEDRLLVADIHGERSRAVLGLLSAEHTGAQVARFLVGFPRRYLASHSPERIAAHYRMALRLGEEPFQITLSRERNSWQLVLLTHDRPRIFVAVVGTLYAWGMSIAKAEAFASTAGVICDTFHFVDLFRTLDMNPSEAARFEESLRRVLNGNENLARVLARRSRPQAPSQPKVRIATAIRFDQDCSPHSTVLEIIAQDRPGLLYEISSALADSGCNMEVALIDTEGPKAIDVFYLTAGGTKLVRSAEENVRRALQRRLLG